MVEAERRAALEAAVRDCAAIVGARAQVEVDIVTGAPADVLVRDAERHASGLLVVGARGAGAFTRLLLGSVSEAVLRHAGCPVLVARARDETG
jgi:nucleotide-binding universal stress UspA family protein